MKLPLPIDALDDRLAIVGRSGYGKTNAAKVLAELLLETGARVCIIDPTDAWWGLRLKPDGKTPAFPVAIFGGQHGDLPLNEHSGETVGAAIAASSQSCIVSMADFMGENARRWFASAFLSALYAHNREPIHLIVDEADTLAPQKPVAPLDTEVLSRMQQIVRRGRIRGFVPWLITQRPAVISKDVLSQADGLIAFNLTASQDRDAIGAWIEGQADRAEERSIMAEMPKLERGSAMVWLPGRGILERKDFPLSRTFDSGRSPKRGEARPTATLKPIDVEGLRGKIAAVEETVKANDPAALKAQIKVLEAELAKKPAPAFDRSVVDREVKRALEDGFASGFNAAQNDAVKAIWALPSRIASPPPPGIAHRAEPYVPAPVPGPTPPAPQVARPAPPPQRQPGGRATGGNLSKAERLILTVLAQRHPQRVPAERIAAIAGYSSSGGGFNNALSALRGKAFIEQGPSPLAITRDGTMMLGDYDPLPTGPALLAYWMGRVSKAERAILDAAARGHSSKDEIADAAGYAPDGGGFNNALSRLRTLGLITGRGTIELHEDLR